MDSPNNKLINIIVPTMTILYMAAFFYVRSMNEYIIYIFSYVGIAALMSFGFLKEIGVWPFRKENNKTRWPFMIVGITSILLFSAASEKIHDKSIRWTFMFYFICLTVYGYLFSRESGLI